MKKWFKVSVGAILFVIASTSCMWASWWKWPKSDDIFASAIGGVSTAIIVGMFVVLIYLVTGRESLIDFLVELNSEIVGADGPRGFYTVGKKYIEHKKISSQNANSNFEEIQNGDLIISCRGDKRQFLMVYKVRSKDQEGINLAYVRTISISENDVVDRDRLKSQSTVEEIHDENDINAIKIVLFELIKF